MLNLSIILPAYNEAELIGQSLVKLNDYLKKEMPDSIIEVIVVINSPASDGTLGVAQKSAKKLKLNKNHKFIIHDAKKRLGKGGAVKLGMQMAKGEYKLFMDTDLAIPLKYVKQGIHKIINQRTDVVIATRSLSSTSRSTIRLIMSSISSFAVRILILPGFKDTQCGFKLFTDQAADLVFSKLTSSSWSFDMEALLIARQNGLNRQLYA